MKDHNLVKILRTLSKDEYKELEKLIASPFFNEGRNYLPLIKELKQYYPQFDDWRKIKKDVFDSIYGKGRYTETLINTALSRALKMAEEYLCIKAYRKNELSTKYEFVQELFNRELFGIAEKQMKEYKQKILPGEGVTDSLMKARMDYEILNVQLSYKNDKVFDSVKSAVSQTDYHIRFNFMRLAYFLHNMRVNNLMYNTAYDSTFISLYLKSINFKKLYNYLKAAKNKNELDRITLIYILWILGITEPKQEHFYHDMKEQVFENLELFHHHEKYNLLQALEALAWIMQQEVNREKYEKELYILYKMRVGNNILSPDRKHMRLILFRSILTASLNHSDEQFTEKFVEMCIPLLRENQRENMRNYSLAHIYYYKADYGKALAYNNRINFEMFAFKFDTRILQFKIYYELGYYNEAYSLIDTHRHFIKKNKAVSPYYKEIHSGFLSFYTELLKIKQGLSATAPGLLYKKLIKINNITSKKFLLEKIKEAEKA